MTFNPISPAVASDDDRYSTTASPYPNGNSNPSTTPPLPSPSPVSHTSSVTSLVSSSVVSTPSPKPRSINSSSLIGDELATICRDARKSGRLLGRYVISKDLTKENYDLTCEALFYKALGALQMQDPKMRLVILNDAFIMGSKLDELDLSRSVFYWYYGAGQNEQYVRDTVQLLFTHIFCNVKKFVMPSEGMIAPHAQRYIDAISPGLHLLKPTSAAIDVRESGAMHADLLGDASNDKPVYEVEIECNGERFHVPEEIRAQKREIKIQVVDKPYGFPETLFQVAVGDQNGATPPVTSAATTISPPASPLTSPQLSGLITRAPSTESLLLSPASSGQASPVQSPPASPTSEPPSPPPPSPTSPHEPLAPPTSPTALYQPPAIAPLQFRFFDRLESIRQSMNQDI